MKTRTRGQREIKESKSNLKLETGISWHRIYKWKADLNSNGRISHISFLKPTPVSSKSLPISPHGIPSLKPSHPTTPKPPSTCLSKCVRKTQTSSPSSTPSPSSSGPAQGILLSVMKNRFVGFLEIRVGLGLLYPGDFDWVLLRLFEGGACMTIV